MTTREITVGRSSTCDIRLGNNCAYASGRHAIIYRDGGTVYYRDVSRNGTMINNVRVHRRAIPIHYGDSIMIAGRYPLSWNQITPYFPVNPQPQGYNQGYQQPLYPGGAMAPTPPSGNCLQDGQCNEQPDFGWNWGAFMLYPIWGFANGCWWAFLIWIFMGLLNLFVPFVVFVSWLPNLLFGAMGSRWSWSNKDWRNAREFNDSQRAWRPWGIGLFILNIVCVLLVVLFCWTFLLSLAAHLR